MVAADFRCGAWVAGPPSERRLYLDAFLFDSTVPTLLQTMGGRITRSFQLPFVWVLLDRDSVPTLAALKPGAWFTTVVDTANTRRIALIGYSRPASPADTATLRALGAIPRLLWSTGASAEVPDTLVPILRARPEISYVDPDRPVCPATP
jgi:hypothetical protein